MSNGDSNDRLGFGGQDEITVSGPNTDGTETIDIGDSGDTSTDSDDGDDDDSVDRDGGGDGFVFRREGETVEEARQRAREDPAGTVPGIERDDADESTPDATIVFEDEATNEQGQAVPGDVKGVIEDPETQRQVQEFARRAVARERQRQQQQPRPRRHQQR